MYELIHSSAHYEIDEKLSGLFRKLADNVDAITNDNQAVISVQISELQMCDEPNLWTAALLVE